MYFCLLNMSMKLKNGTRNIENRKKCKKQMKGVEWTSFCFWSSRKNIRSRFCSFKSVISASLVDNSSYNFLYFACHKVWFNCKTFRKSFSSVKRTSCRERNTRPSPAHKLRFILNTYPKSLQGGNLLLSVLVKISFAFFSSPWKSDHHF